MTPDPFADVRFGQKPSKSNNSQDPFADVRFSQENIKQNFARQASRTASRGVETTLGAPGDIQSFVGSIFGLDQYNDQFSPTEGNLISDEFTPMGLPTSKQFKEAAETLSGGYLKAKNAVEEKADEFTQDIVGFLVSKTGLLKSLGLSVLGNVAKESAQSFGVDKDKSNLVKAGSMLLGSLLTKGKGIDKVKQEAYNKRDELIPDVGLLQRGNHLLDNLDKLETQLKSGSISTPSTTGTLKAVNDLQKDIANRGMTIKELIDAKVKVNELRSGLFDEVKDTVTRKSAKKNLNNLSKVLDEEIKLTGTKYPKFYEAQKEADLIHGTIEQSKKASSAIHRNLKKTGLAKAGILALEEVFGLGSFIPGTLAAGAGAYGALRGSELAYRFMKNKKLRDYYLDVIKESSKENSPNLVRALKDFSEEYQSDSRKQK